MYQHSAQYDSDLDNPILLDNVLVLSQDLSVNVSSLLLELFLLGDLFDHVRGLNDRRVKDLHFALGG